MGDPVHYVRGTTDICFTSDARSCSDRCFRIVQYGEHLYVATNKNELEVHSFHEGHALDSLIRFDTPVSALCLPNSFLFIGTRNSKVVMIDLHDTNSIKNFDQHQGLVIDLHVHSEKQFIEIKIYRPYANTFLK